MAKGIIYVMTTVVPGLIKIGKTGSENFESRMSGLERNGYSNVVGLKRRFAIEVNDYDEKEMLLDEIFSKSRVSSSELFAIDAELVVQLLSSFEGKQIYPKTISKEEVFEQATTEHYENQVKADMVKIPNGIYTLSRKVNNFGEVKGKMHVHDGQFIVLKGAICAPSTRKWQPRALKNANIKNNILQEDVVTSSPSTASWIIVGKADNGWLSWKNKDGELIEVYRQKLKK